jgi:hypothetical protein
MSPGSRLGNLFAGTPRPAGESQEDRLAPAVLTDNSTSETPSPADAYLLLREAIDSFNQGHTKAGANNSSPRTRPVNGVTCRVRAGRKQQLPGDS